MKTLAVIGAGHSGRDFAAACAQAGMHVVLEDVMPSRLHAAETALKELGASVDVVSTVEDAVREADFAIDFVPDELESKLELVCMMDRMAPPKTILLIHTNALSVADLAACTYRTDRCVGIRLHGESVELVAAKASEEAFNQVEKLCVSAGFVVNSVKDRVVN